MSRFRKSNQSGFTLIELMVALCIIACLLALLVPKTWPIIQKKRNLSTLNDCATVGKALSEYALLSGGAWSAVAPIDVTQYQSRTHAEMEDLLVPTFLSRVPELDAWGRPFEFYWFGDDFGDTVGPQIYVIRSSGLNKQFEGDSYDIGPFELDFDPSTPAALDDDIVCADGEVIRWPGLAAAPDKGA